MSGMSFLQSGTPNTKAKQTAQSPTLPFGSVVLSAQLPIQPQASFTGGQKPKNASTVAAPQFGGWGHLLMLGPVVSGFAALDQPTSMISVALRDGLDSSGRVYQEFKRNVYGGWESLITEVSGMLVWGFGIALCKAAYDALVPWISKGKILLPGLETDLLPRFNKQNGTTEKAGLWNQLKKTAPAQQLQKGANQFKTGWNQLAEQPGLEYILGKIGNDTETMPNRGDAQILNKTVVGKYFKDTSGMSVEGEAPWARSQSRASQSQHFQKQKAHLLELVEGNGANQKHLERYLKSNLMKLFFCTTLPVLALGALVPLALHKLTPWLMKRDDEHKAKKAEKMANENLTKNTSDKGTTPNFQPMPNTAPVVSPITGNLNQAPSNNSANTVSNIGNTNNATTPTTPTPVRFQGGLDQMLNPLVSFFLARDTLTTMTFVDFPLSSSRVAMARNSDERKEILFREGAIILVLFWLQRAIQERVAKFFDRQYGAHSNIDIKAIHQLYEKLAKQPPQAINAIYKNLQGTLDTVVNSQHSFEAEQKLVEDIRRYFSDHRDTGANLLFDLAEASGKIHTLETKGKKYASADGVHYIDLNRRIDTDGVRELAQYLTHLNQSVSHEKPLSKLLIKNAGLKMGAFAVSAAACWGIVSYVVPKVQHLITYRSSGQDEFPGIRPA
jgi:hypothetical protein